MAALACSYSSSSNAVVGSLPAPETSAKITKILKGDGAKRVIRYIIDYPASHKLIRVHRIECFPGIFAAASLGQSRVEISVPSRKLVIVSVNLITFQFYVNNAPRFADSLANRFSNVVQKDYQRLLHI